MTMPGRTYTSGNSSYRYGFNGKEKDNSTAEGSYDFGARIYDGRIGRWLGVDKFASLLCAESPYSSNGNSPLVVVDRDGNWRIVVHLIYDFKTKSITVFAITTERGLKEIQTKENYNSANNTWTNLRSDWYDYIDFKISPVNKPDEDDADLQAIANYQSSYRTVGNPVATTYHEGGGFRDLFLAAGYALWNGTTDIREGAQERAIGLSGQDPRGGVMWVTKECKECQGAGVWGTASGVENIEEFKKAMDNLAGEPDFGKLVEKVREKIEKVKDNIPKSFSGTDTKNKPTDPNSIVEYAKRTIEGSLSGATSTYCRNCNENVDPKTGKPSKAPVKDSVNTHYDLNY
jgi:RHS repeat-associated protein